MNRRKFLMEAGLLGASLLVINHGINNKTLYSSEELKERVLFSTNLPSLEKTIMVGELLTEKNPVSLVNLHEEISKDLKIGGQIERIREEIIEKVMEYSKKFIKKRPSEKDFEKKTNEIDEMASEIYRLKEDTKINFINLKRNVFVLLNDDQSLIEFGNSNLEEFHRFDNYYSLALSHEKKTGYNFFTSRIIETLKKLSLDASFIAEASRISGVPIKKIVAFADIESMGKEFSIGKDGEVNRFQLHPKYLDNNYYNAISVKNSLSDYINENSSKKTLLEDLVRNSKLNTAMAVNLMKYLEENTNENYESVLAYNRGLSRALGILPGIRKKLRNPKKITERESKRNPIYGYYINFLSASKRFEEIRDYLTEELKAQPNN